MRSRSIVLICLLAVVAATACGYFAAEMRNFELMHRVPTTSIQDSKEYGVFAGILDATPRELELGDSRWKIEDTWLEHRTEPDRRSPFYTGQTIYSDLVLCVHLTRSQVTPELAPTDISLKDAQVSHVLTSSKNGVYYTEVGNQIPDRITLQSKDRDKEAVIELRKRK